MSAASQTANARAVAEWNEQHPIGTPVSYWTGDREGPGRLSKTRSWARVLGGNTPVVWVEGQSGCITLTHVDRAFLTESDYDERVQLAKVAYQAYGAAADWKNYQGVAMPAWDGLSGRTRTCWVMAASAAVNYVLTPPVQRDSL